MLEVKGAIFAINGPLLKPLEHYSEEGKVYGLIGLAVAQA